MFDEPLDDPLELGETGRRRSIVTLGHVLAHTQDQTLFSDLVDGVAQGREAANLAVTRKQNQIESASGLGNAVVKSVISGVNGGQTLQQAQAQRDQGAASQQQALSQGGLQFLQDAMKTPDQLFESCYAAAAQVLTGNLATMVSVDTRA
jgi:hypothetical protein